LDDVIVYGQQKPSDQLSVVVQDVLGQHGIAIPDLRRSCGPRTGNEKYRTMTRPWTLVLRQELGQRAR
jgi:hypothetical protein